MASLNKVQLLGNVGADPEIRKTQQGTRIANLRLATSESWTDRGSGEKREHTDWHTIVIFGPSDGGDGITGVVEKYVKKGTKIYVEGKLQTRSWEDQQGQKRYSTEVVLKPFFGQLILLGDPGSGGRRGPESPEDYGSAKTDADRDKERRLTGRSFKDDIDDEIPF
jgi:single-strand DNA-binding protein